jgi:hypothetical protein
MELKGNFKIIKTIKLIDFRDIKYKNLLKFKSIIISIILLILELIWLK